MSFVWNLDSFDGSTELCSVFLCVQKALGSVSFVCSCVRACMFELNGNDYYIGICRYLECEPSVNRDFVNEPGTISVVVYLNAKMFWFSKDLFLFASRWHKAMFNQIKINDVLVRVVEFSFCVHKMRIISFWQLLSVLSYMSLNQFNEMTPRILKRLSK